MIDPDVLAIDAALKASSRPRADVGRLLGLDSTQLNRLFNGKRKLQKHEHQKVQEWLGLGAAAASTPGATILPMPGMVPLYGWVGAASENRLTLADQNLRGYVPMHPSQNLVRDPFALEVNDVSMVPRYEPGEIVYLAPNRWPIRGQDCVVVTTAGDGMLKRFLRKDAEAIHLFQLNPEKELSIPLSEIESVHSVVGRN